VFERAGVSPEQQELTVYKLLRSSLNTGLTPDELARFRAEGAAMRPEDAVKLVLGT